MKRVFVELSVVDPQMSQEQHLKGFAGPQRTTSCGKHEERPKNGTDAEIFLNFNQFDIS